MRLALKMTGRTLAWVLGIVVASSFAVLVWAILFPSYDPEYGPGTKSHYIKVRRPAWCVRVIQVEHDKETNDVMVWYEAKDGTVRAALYLWDQEEGYR